MNSKIIIVKLINDLEEPIHYLELSYTNNKEYYYIVNDKDAYVISENNNLECMVAFVVFEALEPDAKEKITKIYIGDGKIQQDSLGWIIWYKIFKCFSSQMIINNFISNSELDLRNDFEINSYVNIENNVELVNQMNFLVNPIYKAAPRPVDEQKYLQLAKENGLHEYSQHNEHCIRPIGIMNSQEHRSEFQRDYERIVHTKAFRRLVDKAQIFTSSKGDHYRTRMTHTLEVTQIARAIAIGLNLNVELTEAIALAHDLGHTPFGHQGERTLDAIMKGKFGIIDPDNCVKNFFGGFKHNFQGIRVVSHLEEKYIEFDGIDLSYQVLEGILKHTSTNIKKCEQCINKNDCNKCFDLQEFLCNGDIERLYPDIPVCTTLEGQIVSIADEIAQRSHDLDDSFASGILDIQQLSDYLGIQKMESLREPLENIKQSIKKSKELNRVFVNENELHHSNIVSAVIHFFISDVINNSELLMREFEENDFYRQEHRFDRKLINFSNSGKILCDYLEKIISKKVINSSEVVQFDNKAEMIVKGLFSAYYNNPKLLHKGTLRKIYIEMRKYSDEIIDFLNGDLSEVHQEIEYITEAKEPPEDRVDEYKGKRKILVRAIADYISGMTDSYAINEYNSIYM